MIVEYVRYRITSDPEAFERAYAEAEPSLRESKHCLRWELARCHEEPDRYVLRLEWDSLDGHLTGFRKSPGFRAFFAAVRPYVDQIEEMQHYVPGRVRSD